MAPEKPNELNRGVVDELEKLDDNLERVMNPKGKPRPASLRLESARRGKDCKTLCWGKGARRRALADSECRGAAGATPDRTQPSEESVSSNTARTDAGYLLSEMAQASSVRHEFCGRVAAIIPIYITCLSPAN
jgi:hypothetical protein